MENLFFDNKYTRWYYQIIKSATNRECGGYTEIHHIIPVCFYITNRSKGLRPGWLEGDPNTTNNLVKLTAREHFVCHWLLTKMVISNPARIKMEYALSSFRRSMIRIGLPLTSIEYERLKLAYTLSHKGRIRGPSSLKGKKHLGPPKLWWNNGHQESKSIMPPAADWSKGRLPSPLSGKPNSSKGRKWWNNGIVQVMQESSPGENWESGKLFRPYSQDKTGRRGKTYQPHSQETRAKISKANSGRKRSSATREQMSKDRTGRISQTKGTKYYTNGIVEIRRKDHPGDGWWLGRRKTLTLTNA